MSDSSVKSSAQKTNSSGGNETNSAFADAVQRARQLAAKIHSTGDSNSVVSTGTKRPLEDSMNGVADGTPELKKMASSDPYGQVQGMQQRNGAGADFVVEEYQVPDKMVGLIIGRGGEQIIRLQTETGCKIQLASDSSGAPNRPCTLTGSRESVEAVKSMIDQIISKANSPFPPDPGHIPDGQYVAEMMIPGPKVGLLIGKGGENIRNLQEKGGVKMVLIQDGPQQTAHEKPLRISGDPQKVEFAKQMVVDLLAQKEMERGYNGGGGGGGGGGGPSDEIMVPRQAVGVVIGKGGDMIKRIQQDSGARVQFIQGKEDLPGDKLCQISGNPDQVGKAGAMIKDLIQSVLMGGGGNMGGGGMQGGGRGRGRGGGGRGGGMMRGDFGPGGPRMGPRPGGGGGEGEIQFSVPANKCGLVIGKGGETVRNINQQSGAHVEIARGAPPSPHEKVFTIRGSPNQIEHAKQLIMERVGGMPMGQGGPPGGPNHQGGPQGQGYPGQQYQQQYQQPGPGQPYAQPGWPGGAYQPWPNQPAAASVAVASNDPTKAAADANAAAWAAYYAYYNQPGQPQAQPQPGQMPQPQQTAQPQAQPQAGAGQADYSAAWVEYYRSLGMFREAEMIEQQGGQATPQGGQPPIPQGQPSQPSGQGAPTPAAAQPAATPAGGYPGAAYPAPGQQPQPAQVPYGQPAPYPGYSYAAAYGAQQPYQAAAPQ